ncbi:porin [Paraburkholderia sp. J63]|uniref:porin n=1 Tax=Paraburkholderia sp. J63 TaxID=2805434 RepID=UPI002ABE512C|nr:porin [Paraburkholderia sp. J63]
MSAPLNQPKSTAFLSGSILPASGTLEKLRFQNFEVNGKYQIAPVAFVGAEYVYTPANYDSTSGGHRPVYQTAGLMADYNLSKRTDLYAQADYVHVGGDKTGTALDYALVPGATGPSSTRNQAIVRLSIRHKF